MAGAKRGFAAMDKEKQREIARKGGASSHKNRKSDK
jgi:general stress protein YciG